MIVLGEKGKNENILHIIIGPETENQFNFSGQSLMDITEYVRRMKPNEKCTLVINRCESEEEMIQHIAYTQGRVQASEIMRELQKKLSEDSTDLGNNFPGKKSKPTLNPKKKGGSGVKCPLCLRDNAGIVQGDMVYPCETCQEIDKGLESPDIPPPPPTASLKDLRDQFSKEHPEQKGSISRYIEGEDELYNEGDDHDDSESEQDADI